MDWSATGNIKLRRKQNLTYFSNSTLFFIYFLSIFLKLENNKSFVVRSSTTRKIKTIKRYNKLIIIIIKTKGSVRYLTVSVSFSKLRSGTAVVFGLTLFSLPCDNDLGLGEVVKST